MRPYTSTSKAEQQLADAAEAIACLPLQQWHGCLVYLLKELDDIAEDQNQDAELVFNLLHNSLLVRRTAKIWV